MALFIIVALGFALRAYRLNFQSLWHDELLTHLNANDTFIAVLVNSQDVNIPPLYYVIVHFLLSFDSYLSLMRIPSLIFGSVSILLFYLVLVYWFDRLTSLVGTFLLAISPFHIWYSQEARPYALLLLLSLLSIWLFQQSIKNEKHPWWKVGFVISTTAIFYCHTLTAAFVGFLVTYIVLQLPRQKWRNWLVPFGSVALLVLPVIYRLLVVPPVGSANAFHSSKPLASIAYTIWAFGTGYSLGPNLIELHRPDRTAIVWSYISVIMPVMLLLSSLLVLGAVQQKKRPQTFWFAVLWFIFPLGFALLGSIFTVHPFNVRYAILSFPPFLFLLTAGIMSIKPNWLKAIAVGAISTISITSLMNYYFDEGYHRDDNRSAGVFLSNHALPNDLVIVSAAYTSRNLNYYYQGEPLTIVPYPTGMSFEEDNGPASNTTGAFFIKPDRTAFDLERIIAKRERFWVFLSRTFHSDPDGTIRNFLDEKYSQKLLSSWPGVELILYEAPTSSREAK